MLNRYLNLKLRNFLGKKKQLAVININEEQMSVEKIRELPNPVKHVAMDGVFVCAALTSHYVIFNVATGTCQDLFPYEPETHPIITRISKVRVHTRGQSLLESLGTTFIPH